MTRIFAPEDFRAEWRWFRLLLPDCRTRRREESVLLAARQSTCHVEKDPVREGGSQQPPGSGSGSGSSSISPPPLAMNEGAGAGGSEGSSVS